MPFPKQFQLNNLANTTQNMYYTVSHLNLGMYVRQLNIFIVIDTTISHGIKQCLEHLTNTVSE